jgi:kumamolisin
MPSGTHVILPGSRRPKDTLAKRIGPVDPKEKFDVTLGLVGPKLPSADEYVNQTLTPEELAEKFGTQKANADKVAKILKKYGLHVDKVLPATQSMRVSGTAAALEAAFKPNWAMMRSPTQGEYRGREGPLYIPVELKGLVDGVFGLDERRMARRKARAKAAPTGLAPLTPADLEQRYNFPLGGAAGQSVAIAEFGGGYFADDLSAYCNKFQRPVPKVQAIAVDAPAYTLAQIQALPPRARAAALDDSVEVMMDVQIVAGLCSQADILVYFSAFDQGGWVNLLDEAIAAKPAVLSVSWGLAEEDSGWSQGAIDAINDRLNAARLLGITVCASSGDDGSGDQLDDGKAHIDFPSSSPFTLAVGGTMLAGSGASVKEVTWWEAPGRRTNNGGGSTGGGVSMHFQRPTWQNVHIKSLNPGSIDGRVTPDIAALAGDPLYDLIFLLRDQPNGGTSASTPLWASLIARISANLATAKQQRFVTPLLYQNASNGQPIGKSCSRDITSGVNTSDPEPGKGYKAGPGFDAVTGWGVPDGVKLQDAFAAV